MNAAIVLGLSVGATAAQAAVPLARSWHFAVLLDGKPIGEHDFTVTPQGDEISVDSRAHFKVRAAFLALYHYDHEDHEVWRDGCLASLASHTDDNGKKVAVRGMLQGQVFEVDRSAGADRLPPCVMTFAYWDPAFLKQSHLLNSQTGQYEPVTIVAAGTQNVAVGTQSVPAQHYTVRAPDLAIDLWYSSAGEWLALESKLKSGRMLRYETR